MNKILRRFSRKEIDIPLPLLEKLGFWFVALGMLLIIVGVPISVVVINPIERPYREIIALLGLIAVILWGILVISLLDDKER